jgi:hypothetical protein
MTQIAARGYYLFTGYQLLEARTVAQRSQLRALQ